MHGRRAHVAQWHAQARVRPVRSASAQDQSPGVVLTKGTFPSGHGIQRVNQPSRAHEQGSSRQGSRGRADLALGLIALSAACGGAVSPTEDSDAGPCPTSVAVCPAGCRPVIGSPIGPSCVENKSVHLGCGPELLFILNEFCLRGTEPDASAYLLPPGSAGSWLTQPGAGFEHCADEPWLPDGSPKPRCKP